MDLQEIMQQHTFAVLGDTLNEEKYKWQQTLLQYIPFKANKNIGDKIDSNFKLKCFSR